MSFQRHETPEQKFLRRCKYTELIESGQSVKRSSRFRDWTLPKVRLIASGYANPV